MRKERSESGREFNRAKRSLGQNFLNSSSIVSRIVELIDNATQKFKLPILEVGPGRGALTRELALTTDSLLLIEKDDDLSLFLKDEYNAELIELDDLSQEIVTKALNENEVVIIHADFLEAAQKLDLTKFIICGNLPFNVSKQIFYDSVLAGVPAGILMFQKEVVNDILNRKRRSYSSFFGENYLTRTETIHVPRSAFIPSPKVDGVVLKFETQNELKLSLEEHREFYKFVKTSLLQRRKKIINTIVGAPVEYNDERFENLDISRAYNLFNEVKKSRQLLIEE